MDLRLSKITYYFLASNAFQLVDAQHYESIMAMSIKALFEINGKIMELSENASDNLKNHLVIILRLIGNIGSICSSTMNYFINTGFIQQNESLALFLNNLLSFLSNDKDCYKELLWFIGNIVNNSDNLNQDCCKYLENDKFLDKLVIKTI